MRYPAKYERIGRTDGPTPTKSEIDFRLAITETFRGLRQSRQEVAEVMTRLSGQPVTESMLNDFSAISKGTARFPGWLIAAFCEATNDSRLLLAASRPRDREFFRLGQIVAELIDDRTRALLLKYGKGSGRAR